MLNDNESRKHRVIKPRKIGDEGKHWSDSQKIEAVKTVLILGNVAMASAALKIPDETLRRWRRSQWWKDIENDLRVETNLQLSARLVKIVERSLDVVSDRLDNGDWILDKENNMIRKPVTMRDAHVVAKDMIDKSQQLSRAIETAPAEATIAERMVKLAETFAALAQKNNNPVVVNVTDVITATEIIDESEQDDIEDEDLDALHDESRQ